jgi:tRNA(fMet)-specific endonuclease VapC
MVLLDTDLLTLLERGGSDALALQARLDGLPRVEVATTIVTYEEQSRGWMARISQAKTKVQLEFMYRTLGEHLDTFCEIPVVPFDGRAVEIYYELRRSVKIGTMDLKIAAIALANDATLLSRNVSDFRRVPGLRIEDWSA